MIAENNLYVFHEDKIKSKMTGEYLKKHKNSRREFSMIKKYNVRNKKGQYLINYPLTEEKVNEYLKNS